jgi:hypothetical protein
MTIDEEISQEEQMTMDEEISHWHLQAFLRRYLSRTVAGLFQLRQLEWSTYPLKFHSRMTVFCCSHFFHVRQSWTHSRFQPISSPLAAVQARCALYYGTCMATDLAVIEIGCLMFKECCLNASATTANSAVLSR